MLKPSTLVLARTTILRITRSNLHPHLLPHPRSLNYHHLNPNRTMHLRPGHAITDLPTLHAFIRAHPLGVLTTSLPSENFPTLQCSHIPWILDGIDQVGSASGSGSGSESRGSEKGVLRGHIARANPHTQALIEAVTVSEAGKNGEVRVGNVTGPLNLEHSTTGTGMSQSQSQSYAETSTASASASASSGSASGSVLLPGEVLIVFTSPVDHYITPQFYTGTIQSQSANATTSAGGGVKIAPTWNYAAVQVYGRMRVYFDREDSGTGEFLMRQLADLAYLGEVGIMGYRESNPSEGSTASAREGQGQGDEWSSRSGQGRSPWKIADAPVEYISTLKKMIVGMEVEISRIEGRFKGSQEKGVEDRDGVIGGLEGMGSVRAKQMADFVKECNK